MTIPKSTLPIDLALADQLFPLMESAAKNLEHVPQFYEDLDHFFWRNFLELFPDPDDPYPPGIIWDTLLRLRNTADLSLITEPIVHLNYNNDRINTALAALSALLKC